MSDLPDLPSITEATEIEATLDYATDNWIYLDLPFAIRFEGKHKTFSTSTVAVSRGGVGCGRIGRVYGVNSKDIPVPSGRWKLGDVKEPLTLNYQEYFYRTAPGKAANPLDEGETVTFRFEREV